MDWAELEELKKVDVRTVDISALEDIEKIDEVKRVYEQHLLRSSKVKMKTM